MKTPSKSEIIVGMASYYSKEIDKNGLGLYLNLLKNYTPAQVENAVALAVKTEKTFPVFAALRRYLEQENYAKLDDMSQMQADWILSHLRLADEPAYDDPITERIMTGKLKFSDWIERSTEDLVKFFKPSFIKEYKRIMFNDAERKRLKPKKALKPAPKTDEEVYGSALSETMRKNKEWIKGLMVTSGEKIEFYYMHDWAIFEGSNHSGRVLQFDDDQFKEKVMSSELFEKCYPRSIAYAKGHRMPAVTREGMPRVLTKEEADLRMAEIRNKLRALNANKGKKRR